MRDAADLPDESRDRQAIHWGRVFLEGLVIVTGILLALGAEAWWQDRNDRAEERVLLSALHDEFSGNLGTLRAQSDSISQAILVLESVISMTETELASALETDRRAQISMAIQRPWTVEFRVGALDGTLGTERGSLIESLEVSSELAQYQSVRKELDEIGGMMATVAVQAFVSFGALPESHGQLTALLKAKVGYWAAYRAYLESIAGLLAEELGWHERGGAD